MRGFIRSLATAFVLFTAGAASSALADPPARVGRLSLIDGDVTFHDTATRESSPATLNWPVTGGAAISTAPGAHAEVRIGSTAVRLDGATALEFTQVDDQAIRLRLDYGAATLRVRSREVAGEVALETQDARVSLSDAGRYRVEAGRAPDTTAITVFEGAARVDANGIAFAVQAGRRAEVGGGRARVVEAFTDEFDGWTLARDRRDAAAQSVALRLARDHRLRVARRVRRLARDARLRPGVVPARGPRRLGALSRRPLGVGRAVGLDVDRRGAVGLRAVPLRTVGAGRRRVGLGSRRGRRAPGVCAGARRVDRPARLERERDDRQRARGRLVPARAAGGVRPRLPDEPRVRAQREHHAGHERERHQRQRDADAVRVPAGRAGGHRGARGHGHRRCAGRTFGGARAARGSRRGRRRHERAADRRRTAAAAVRQPSAKRRRAMAAQSATRGRTCRHRGGPIAAARRARAPCTDAGCARGELASSAGRGRAPAQPRVVATAPPRVATPQAPRERADRHDERRPAMPAPATRARAPMPAPAAVVRAPTPMPTPPAVVRAPAPAPPIARPQAATAEGRAPRPEGNRGQQREARQGERRGG